jgi:AcrR family transcriptional regulator
MRADAIRNHQKVLTAADRLVRRHGAEALTIADVAAASGVGNGTVIRRFGDKAGLLASLLGEHERRLQEEIIRGKPPLGPGAPPLARIEEFLARLAKLYLRELDLVHASETAAPGARYRVGAHAAWRQHVTMLVQQARPGLDAPLVAHLLLAPLDAEALAETKRMRRAAALPDALRLLARAVLR